MEELLSKLSNLLIVSCRTHILAVDSATETRGNLWKKSPANLCRAFQDCINLRVAFEDHYRCVTSPLFLRMCVLVCVVFVRWGALVLLCTMIDDIAAVLSPVCDAQNNAGPLPVVE
jgi:hypothetical protein